MFLFPHLIRLSAAANLLAQIPTVYPLTPGSLEDFITSESSIALQGVLNNVGSQGLSVDGAASGLVVASPSKANPDCQCFL